MNSIAEASGVPRFVGQSVQRKEDPRLVSGNGTYLDDVKLPNMLHVSFVRSDVARALIDGRLSPSIDDVADMAEPNLKHRMALTFAARADGETLGGVIAKLASRVG
jgi:hypothetical protein